MQTATLKLLIVALSIVAVAVLFVAFMKVQESKNARIEKMTENLDYLRKKRSGKAKQVQSDFISSDGYSQEKLLFGGGKSGGREQ